MTIQKMLDAHVNKYHYETRADQATTTVSFVVPVYNSEDSIRLCIKSIVSQKHPELISDIVLVDDGSTDGTSPILDKLKDKYTNLPIKIIRNGTRQYAAYSRNRGVEACSGDLVCFVDSDILLPSNYMINHIWRHQQGAGITLSLRQDITLAEARTISLDKTPVLPKDFRLKVLQKNNNLQDVPFQLGEYSLAELCLTCAVTYRRKDLVQVYGCPENFKGWGFNDTAIAAKVIALGRNVVPVDTTTYHINHAPRSGSNKKKMDEYAANERRYFKMLQLPLEQTFTYNISDLE